ncbi:hypothetical protein MSIMFB_05605 [Mycobacterium simulans]|uniref:WXG100 family type VII secretion target n=1 Tax=Mycobacterium simulans TaxID=627089 RepID=A0A7Z7NCN8_9MYCO|nr:WXG100 family type VII secretion target [Mycobacterium simulans]SOJ58125.1 hypothetical protein MSIMFB_05605 [Mycobacterium simulans]
MFQIRPEQWIRSAAHVSGQGEDLAAGHLLSDNRIEAAQSGWQGASALAINAKMADWRKKSTALVTGIGSHAHGLQEAAIQHAAAEEERARALARVSAAGDIAVSSKKV